MSNWRVEPIGLDLGGVLVARDRGVFAQRLLDLVQPALAISKRIQGLQVGSQLGPFGSGQIFLDSANVVANKIKQVVSGVELLLRRAAGHAAKQSGG